jgi:hypothetical protein
VTARRYSTRGTKGRPINQRTRTAFHEAGHAVLSAAIADTPQHVSIRPVGHTLGRSGARMSALPTSRVQVHLAGFAAEHVLTGRRSRQLDKEVGFAILGRYDPELRAAFAGSEDQDGYRAVQEVLNMGVWGSVEETKREVDRCYDVARESLSAVWPAVEAVATALLKREELDRDDVVGAIGEADVFSPVFAVQRAHGLLPVLPPPVGPRAKVVGANMKQAAKTPKTSSRAPAVSAGDDPRVAALLKAFKANPKLAAVVDTFEANVGRGRKFGSNGLKVGGKLFALFTQGTLVVKLPKTRVAALVAARIGEQFDPGHGRLMKEWLMVRSAKVSWIDLAKDAHDFVKGVSRTARRVR